MSAKIASNEQIRALEKGLNLKEELLISVNFAKGRYRVDCGDAPGDGVHSMADTLDLGIVLSDRKKFEKEKKEAAWIGRKHEQITKGLRNKGLTIAASECGIGEENDNRMCYISIYGLSSLDALLRKVA